MGVVTPPHLVHLCNVGLMCWGLSVSEILGVLRCLGPGEAAGMWALLGVGVDVGVPAAVLLSCR